MMRGSGLRVRLFINAHTGREQEVAATLRQVVVDTFWRAGVPGFPRVQLGDYDCRAGAGRGYEVEIDADIPEPEGSGVGP